MPATFRSREDRPRTPDYRVPAPSPRRHSGTPPSSPSTRVTSPNYTPEIAEQGAVTSVTIRMCLQRTNQSGSGSASGPSLDSEADECDSTRPASSAVPACRVIREVGG